MLMLPWLFWIALGGIGLVSALHLLTHSLQAPQSFPPLRFVPRRKPRAAVLRLRPSDPWLWLLRLVILLLLGAAFAGPRLVWPGSSARIVLVEESTLIAPGAETKALIAGAVKGARTVLVFGSNPALQATDSPRLSPALITALRQRAELSNRYETVQLTIVAGFASESFDAATPAIRALWPGPVELIALPLVAARPARSAARMHPPEASSPLWQAHPAPGQVNGILTPTGPLLAPFQRSRAFVTPLPPDTRPVAWWLDGAPAAVERISPSGREIWAAFELPEEGDALAQASFRRHLDWLAGEEPAPLRLDAADLADFARGPATATLAPAARVTPLAPWLLALALVLMLAEPLLSRRPGTGPEAEGIA